MQCKKEYEASNVVRIKALEQKEKEYQEKISELATNKKLKEHEIIEMKNQIDELSQNVQVAIVIDK